MSTLKRTLCGDDGDTSGDRVGTPSEAMSQDDKPKASSSQQTAEGVTGMKDGSGGNSETPKEEMSPPTKRAKVEADATADSEDEVASDTEVLSQEISNHETSYSETLAKALYSVDKPIGENADEEDEEEDEDFELDQEDEEDSGEDEELDDEDLDEEENIGDEEIDLTLPAKRVRRAVGDTTESGEESADGVLSQADNKAKNSATETAGQDVDGDNPEETNSELGEESADGVLSQADNKDVDGDNPDDKEEVPSDTEII